MIRALVSAILLSGCIAGAPDATSLTPDSSPVEIPLLFGFRCSFALPAQSTPVSIDAMLRLCGVTR